MDAAKIGQLGKELRKYMRQFADCFGRCEPRAHAQTYVRGQLSDLPRKSVEPMADQAGIDPRALQRFLAERLWDEGRMTEKLHGIVARDHAAPHAIAVVDETSFVKKGTKTPGVQRQYCGATGKKDNCTVTVHLGYAVQDFHCLLSSALYLPESWSSDRERCRAAGIPDALVHRPKWQLALELHQQACAQGVVFKWLTADEGYGAVPEFQAELSRRQQLYVVEVPRNFWCWSAPPRIVSRPRSGRLEGRGPLSVVEDLARYSRRFAAQDWQPYHIKDGTKGPIVWEVKSGLIFMKGSTELPAVPAWLIVGRNALDHEEIKFFVSNAPLETPLETLLCVGFSRWHVERCFEDEKNELGMDHFEVRTYCALMRHLALTAVSHLFVARVHQQEKKLPGLDGVPGADRSQCVPGGAEPPWRAAPEVPGAGRDNPGQDPIPHCQGRAQSPQEDAAPAETSRNLCLETAAV